MIEKVEDFPRTCDCEPGTCDDASHLNYDLMRSNIDSLLLGVEKRAPGITEITSPLTDLQQKVANYNVNDNLLLQMQFLFAKHMSLGFGELCLGIKGFSLEEPVVCYIVNCKPFPATHALSWLPKYGGEKGVIFLLCRVHYRLVRNDPEWLEYIDELAKKWLDDENRRNS